MEEIKQFSTFEKAILEEIEMIQDSIGKGLTISEKEYILNYIINDCDYLWEDLNAEIIEKIEELKGDI